MARKNRAAVGDGVQEAFSPIPCHMEADTPPQIARPSQRETQEEANQSCSDQAGLPLAGIFAVHEPERERKKDRGGPEIKSASKDPLRVAAQEELFEESCKEKKKGVISREFPDASSV